MNTPTNLPRRATSAFLALMILVLCNATAQTITQTIVLQLGWNAIYVEVQPVNQNPAAVFSDAAISKVWDFRDRTVAADFIQNAEESAWNTANWLLYVPGPEGAVLNNLSAVQANRGYLVKVDGSVPIPLNITGTPVVRDPAWTPNAFNLKSFPVDPANPSTFASYFAAAPAHFNSAANALRPMYRLNSTGSWVQVAGTDLMKSGEAYWVYSEGASTFKAPVEISVGAGTSLNFGSTTETLSLSLRNRTASARSLLLENLQDASPGLLALEQFDVEQGSIWPDLPLSLSTNLPANATLTLRLAVRRSAMTGNTYATILSIKDDQGTRQLVPILAGKLSTSDAGLWVGTATLNAVSEPHSGILVTNTSTGEITRQSTSDVPTPTSSEFSLRLMLHVDAGGNARLLKEVIQMWEDGTYTNNSQGFRVVNRPGRYVLLTDDRLIGDFSGATLRDGTPVGRRISTAGFWFDAGPTNCLIMSGVFGGANSLSVSITNTSASPTNPFKHRYHPDHDNLDAQYQPITNGNPEVFTLIRDIQLDFSTTNLPGRNDPDYGYDEKVGTYHEKLTGLHSRPLFVQGTFRFTRVLANDQLNPAPLP